MIINKIGLTVFIAYILNLARCDEQPSIVIIGAGAAGIAAATKLLKNNFTNIKILEAENRIGGRIHSVKFGEAYVDLGAEWCHGQENNIVYSMVKDLDILKHTEFNTRLITSKGKEVDSKVFTKLNEFIGSIYDAEEMDPEVEEKCSKENSVGKCFKTVFNSSFVSNFKNDEDIKIALSCLNVIRGYVSSMESALDWDDVSLSGSEYETCKGDFNLNWGGLGSKTILEVMMQKYPPGQQSLPIDNKIILNKEVVSISNWDTKDKTTKIQCKDGSTFAADHVILTPSLGVLKAYYETLFKPELPSEKVDSIRNVGFGAIAKVIMHFPERWWDDDLTWVVTWLPEDLEEIKNAYKDSITKSGKLWLSYLSNIAQAENNSKVLIAWYAADIIPELEELSDKVILEGHKYILRRLLGKTFNVTDPDEILRTKWLSNPHFRGTYSYESEKGFASGGSHFRQLLAKPLSTEDGKLSLQFAGEATNHKHFSTVHGAIDSGFREADRLIDLHKNNK